jgi:GNAT superfamily N-acetyltransferase
MVFRIEAFQRIQAMPIIQGDNYTLGQEDAEKYVEKYKVGNLKLINSSKSDNLALFMTPIKAKSYTFMLVELLPGKLKSLTDGELKLSDITKKPVATIDLQRNFSGNLDSVHSVWVDKEYRNRGFGKTLYAIAHHYAKKSLGSSSNLGSLSLAVWLSLYKQNHEIYIEYKGHTCDRKDIKIDGMKIFDTRQKIELTAPKSDVFLFIWPK